MIALQTLAVRKEKARITLEELAALFGSPRCALDYNTPFELLVAVILSAQCTDARVNIVTKELFKLASTPEDFAGLPQDVLEKYIFSCGFYHSKAKNIISAATIIVNTMSGKVPSDKESLMKLPGVGAKTANVIMAEAFGAQAIAVDTHVGRCARRLGLTDNNDPDKVEKDLCEAVEYSYHTAFHHLLINLGRNICKSRKPDCGNCPLKSICNFFKTHTMRT